MLRQSMLPSCKNCLAAALWFEILIVSRNVKILILKLEQHLAMIFVLLIAQCKSRRIFFVLGPSSILFNVFSIKIR